MKKVIYIISSILIVYLSVFATTKMVNTKLENYIDKSLQIIEIRNNINTIKAKLPMETEEMVELTDASFEEGEKTILYSYKVYFYNKSDIKKEELDFFIESRKGNMINYARSNDESAKMFLENDISFKCIYFYKNGDFMGSFVVKPEDYK